MRGLCEIRDGRIAGGLAIVLAAMLCLLGPAPISAASGHDTTGAAGAVGSASSVPLHRFRGLRSLFVLVRLDIETRLGTGGPIALVLASLEERDKVIEATPPERRDEVAVAHALALGRWAEFERVASEVLKPGAARRFDYGEVLAAFSGSAGVSVVAEGYALNRDRLVEKMAMLGYPPYLIADVVSGRIPIDAVEQATRLRLLGRPESEITRYLEGTAEARARARAIARTLLAAPAPGAATVSPGAPDATWPMRGMTNWRERFEPAVLRSAARHRVDPDLVRAVIRHESGWNPRARSYKGALGLMQLMPETARLLGVDALDPDQNIDGGTRFLASLLVLFDGNLDGAIVGYIGGPAYARRWLRGQLALSGEVRAYLDNVKTSYRGQTSLR